MNTREKILQYAAKHQQFRAADVDKYLKHSITKVHISRVLGKLVSEGKLLKTGSTAGAGYSLPGIKGAIESASLRLKNKALEEHQIYTKLTNKHQFLQAIPENSSNILFYIFTEMLNNAIEHSQTRYIDLVLEKEGQLLTLTVEDYGVGVFRNVMQKRNLRSEVEAMQDLLKGKTTTDPHSHSGEGIFFTSKLVELFSLESFGYRLRVDNRIPDIFFENDSPKKRGTLVTCVLDLQSERHLNDIFRQFVTNGNQVGFDKTEIKVHLYTKGTTYISRSQARRILSGLDKFKSIILDFDQVKTVGQAFADEIFRVFQSRHPHIIITAINTIEPVEFMLKRAGSGKGE